MLEAVRIKAVPRKRRIDGKAAISEPSWGPGSMSVRHRAASGSGACEGRFAGAKAGQMKRRRVALLIESSNAYGRGLLAGIHDHTSASEQWVTFLREHGRGAPPIPLLHAWRGDGIIARIENERIAAVVAKLGLPTIDTSAARLLPELSYVETDDAAIARLAADHFREIGFRNFAFCGEKRFRWSENRRQTFCEEIERHGHTVSVFGLSAGRRSAADEETGRLGQWLAALPKPVAVFACYDPLGRRVIEACHERGLAVPDDVAVLGVDDDELLCRLSTPPLSSIVPDARGAGRLAAELLDRLLDGGNVAVEHLLPPIRVAVRQSTDIVSGDEPLVAQAARFIREHITHGIRVEDIAAALSVSRRLLEQRFDRAVGRTPHEEIVRAQFRLVEDLLRSTDLKLTAIAYRCGFRHPEYMTAAFTRRYGVSPSRWRRINRR